MPYDDYFDSILSIYLRHPDHRLPITGHARLPVGSRHEFISCDSKSKSNRTLAAPYYMG